jgi:hypothetical protein
MRTHISRRDVAKAAATTMSVSSSAQAGAAQPATETSSPQRSARKFPADFYWGTATSRAPLGSLCCASRRAALGLGSLR